MCGLEKLLWINNLNPEKYICNEQIPSEWLFLSTKLHSIFKKTLWSDGYLKKIKVV